MHINLVNNTNEICCYFEGLANNDNNNNNSSDFTPDAINLAFLSSLCRTIINESKPIKTVLKVCIKKNMNIAGTTNPCEQ